jgi:hypothetical protein
MNRVRSGSRLVKLIFVLSDAVIVTAPLIPFSLISVTSPHRIRFSPRNQKCCSIASWETKIVPGNESNSEAARNSSTIGVMTCHHSAEPRRISLMAGHTGNRTMSGHAKYVSKSGENSTRPSPMSLADRARFDPRKCIHARRNAEIRLAADNRSFRIIEIILTPRARSQTAGRLFFRCPATAHPPRYRGRACFRGSRQKNCVEGLSLGNGRDRHSQAGNSNG